MPVKETTYLTKELIEHIQKKVKDPIWKMGVLAAFTKHWYDVIAVSPKDLIHFLGNLDTGWKHISERHGFYSDTNYFGYGKIGNPSKFNRKSIPIEDYVKIADDIYSYGVKDLKPNKKSEIFDKYKGKSNRYIGSNGTPKEFYLILYKGTRIVHSIYPENDLSGNHSMRLLQDFGRCKDKIVATHNLIEDWYTIMIPYENKDKIIRYVVVIRLNEYSLICKVYIQANNFNGTPLFTFYPEQFTFKANDKLGSPIRSGDIEFTRFLNGLGIADFSAIENRILQCEEHFKNEIK
jgi:hypothetical protein